MVNRDVFKSVHEGNDPVQHTARRDHEGPTTLPAASTPLVPTNGTWPETIATTANNAGFIPLGKGENISLARELAPVARLPRFLDQFFLTQSHLNTTDGRTVKCELFPIKVDEKGHVHYGPPLAKFMFGPGFLNGEGDADARMAYVLLKAGVLKPGDRNKYENEIQRHRSDQKDPGPAF